MQLELIKENTFIDNWKFQQDYYEQVKTILKNNSMIFVKVEIADIELDKKQATDFIVIIDGGEIAVRIRRANCKYRDLTIRSVNNGYKTEIDKIREGFGRYYLYCWEDEGKEIKSWILVDLNKLRETKLMENRVNIPNYDGTEFIAISIDELYRNDCLIAHVGVSI